MEHTSSSGESKDPAVVYGTIPPQTVTEIRKICEEVVNEECECGPTDKHVIELAKQYATVTHTHGVPIAVLLILLWMSGAWYFGGYHNQKHMGDVTIVHRVGGTYWFMRPNNEVFTARFNYDPDIACGSHLLDLVYTDTYNKHESDFVKAVAAPADKPKAEPNTGAVTGTGEWRDSPEQTFADPRKGR